MKNVAFIIIGSEDAGKTGIIREWCGLVGKKLNERGITTFEIKINGKKELILINSCSVQERSDFFVIKKVIKELIDWINKHKKTTKDKKFQRFIWILSHTIGVRKNKIGKEAVRESLKTLKKEGFDIVKIYLNREDPEMKKVRVNYKEIDSFAKSICDIELKSTTKKHTEEAKKLNKIITNHLK